MPDWKHVGVALFFEEGEGGWRRNGNHGRR
jgi:hypothetical protein